MFSDKVMQQPAAALLRTMLSSVLPVSRVNRATNETIGTVMAYIVSRPCRFISISSGAD
jgi:hypothetical protein